MNCPACGNRAIRFRRWVVGFSWLRTRCDSCGVELRANRRTFALLALAILLVIVPPRLVGDSIPWLGHNATVILSVVLGTIVGGALGWKYSGYDLASP